VGSPRSKNIEAAGVNFIDIYFRTGLYPFTGASLPGE
jgi:hypothetical protein